MISIGKLVNAEQVVLYLLEAGTDAKVEYYTARGETPGRWTGRVAQHLGLDGEVTSEQLRSLLDGRDHRSGGDLMARRWSRQTVVAFDVTFSAPKSVSLLWAIGDEDTRAAVLRAHQAAVDAVGEYLQDHAGWGRRYDPQSEEVVPVRADLALPQFLHRTARPVTDALSGLRTVDPQLHTHIPIPNFVLRDDGTWGQLHSVALYRHAASAGAVGQAVMRDALVRDLGVQVGVGRNGTFEVVGISRAMRHEFSRRRRQVVAMDAAFGVESADGHRLAVLASREGKQEIAPGQDVFAKWRERGATVGLDREVIGGLLHRENTTERRLDATIRELVGERELTAEAATFTRRDVVRAVAAHAPLGFSLAELERTVDAVLADRDSVIELGELSDEAAAELPSSFDAYVAEDTRYSTPEMVAIEARMLATAEAGRLAGRGLAYERDVERAIAARPSLTGEQQTMIHAVCRRGEAVSLVEGSAGSGKTYALAACREALEAAGQRVTGAALSANAALKLSQEAGIPTTTLHSLLHRLQGAPESINTVIVIDEAAMVGSRQVAQLIECAARDQTKLVLVGDPHQLHAIDGGAAFRALGDRLGTVVMSENVRQVDEWQRHALTNLREGRVAEAVNTYVAHEAIRTGNKPFDVQVELLADYRQAVEQGRDVIMLTHRRDDVAMLNRRAHQQAEDRGQLEGPAISVGEHRLSDDGRLLERPRELRAGDRVLCLENDRTLGLTNGMRVQVINVDPKLHTVTLRTPDNREVSVDVRHYDALDHGYAMTVHKAQGLSVDVGLVLASGDEGREWTYTAMSRGREANHYYIPSEQAGPDEHGRKPHEETTEELAERLTRSWSRSEGADSTLDYEGIEEKQPRVRREPHVGATPCTPATPELTPSINYEPEPPDLSPDLSPSIGAPSPF